MIGRGVSLVLAVCLAACGSSKSGKQTVEEPPPEVEATTAAANDNTAEQAPAKPEPTREELVAAALARVPDITKGVAELRGLEFKHPVPAEYQEAKDFRTFVATEIKRELPPEKNAALGKALAHIGLLPEPMDLAKTLEDAMVSQAGAYYDPKTKKFFLVMVPTSDMILDTISSHELNHALQDQHFDLNKYYYGHDGDGPPAFTEDELAARRFIVEGEATFVMMAYAMYSMAKQNILADPKMAGALRSQLQMMANLSIDQLKEMNKSQAGGFMDMGEDMKKAMEAMDTIPLYILVPLMDSYVKGALPVYEAFMAGGWEAVNELDTTAPPNSTEQVLHPTEKLFPKRDYPVAVSLKMPKGFSEIYTEVMGELGWRVYFMVWKHADAVKAAAGWDGDRYAVWEQDGRMISVTVTVWDSADEAAEFKDAYLATLGTRFPDGTPADTKGITFKPRTGGVIAVQQKGAEVWIADGTDDREAAKHLKVAAKRKLKKDKRDK